MAAIQRMPFGALASTNVVDLATVRVVLWRSEESGFGIEIAENEEGDVVVTAVNSAHAHEAGAREGAIILRVAGCDVERRGLEAVYQTIALFGDLQTEFILRLGQPMPPAITQEDVQAATVLQRTFRGHRERQNLAQQQYDVARREAVSSGGSWGEVKYELGRDEHDSLLERLEAMEHEIKTASTDLSRQQRGARSRARVPLAAGRAGSSTYLDSRTALWSRPNTALAPSRSASGRADEAQRRPGEFQPGQLMSAWDQSQATTARRKGLPVPDQSAAVQLAATTGVRAGSHEARAVSGTRSAHPRSGLSSKSSIPAAPAAPRRSLSKSLAATLESSHDGGVRMGQRTFV